MNAYEVLGLNRNATSREIKEKFRELIILHHPDKQSQQIEDDGEKKSSSSRYKISNSDQDIDEQGYHQKINGAESILVSELMCARDLLLNGVSRRELDIKLDSQDAKVSASETVVISLFEKNRLGTLSYPCRCGDFYELDEDDIRDGVNSVSCTSCSLVIRVVH